MGKKTTVGTFDTEEEATRAGRKMKQEAFNRLYAEATDPELPKLKTTSEWISIHRRLASVF